MEHFQAALDPRKQELLEARFLGARVSFVFNWFFVFFSLLSNIIFMWKDLYSSRKLRTQYHHIDDFMMMIMMMIVGKQSWKEKEIEIFPFESVNFFTLQRYEWKCWVQFIDFSMAIININHLHRKHCVSTRSLYLILYSTNFIL